MGNVETVYSLSKRVESLERKVCYCKEFVTGSGVPVSAPSSSISNFYVDTDTGFIYYWDGTSWGQIGGGGGSSLYSADGALPEDRIVTQAAFNLEFSGEDANTSTTLNMLTLARTTTGTAAAGLGIDVAIDLEDAAGTRVPAGNMVTEWITATAGAETSSIKFTTKQGGALADRLSINGQQIQFNSYGSGTITGTATYSLAVDASGNIIETALGGGSSIYTADGTIPVTTVRTVSIPQDSGTVFSKVGGTTSQSGVTIESTGSATTQPLLKISGNSSSTQGLAYINQIGGVYPGLNVYKSGSGGIVLKASSSSIDPDRLLGVAEFGQYQFSLAMNAGSGSFISLSGRGTSTTQLDFLRLTAIITEVGSGAEYSDFVPTLTSNGTEGVEVFRVGGRGFMELSPITVAQAGAIPTARNGMIVYVSDTDATFTSVGFWGYENGAWTKL